MSLEILKKIGLNLFHIILVAALICSLAKNLAPGNDLLKSTAYKTVGIMVAYHIYKVLNKTVLI